MTEPAALIQAVRPRLRGWLHTVAFPLSIGTGSVLVLLADGATARLACAVYAVTAALLFGISAVYHRGNWSPAVHARLQRLDHANIFLIIAGTYTPFALLVLPAPTGSRLLWTVWAGALLGVLFRVLWLSAPRWLYVPLYLVLGWVAALLLPQLQEHGGSSVVVLLIVGGVLYSVGGLVYGLRRPNPSPRFFGFHEVFHALTVAGFTVQYVAVSLAVYSR